MRQRMQAMVYAAQQRICDALSAIDGTAFQTDTWQRPEGGGGTTRVLEDSRVFEKAGVNVSVVHGELSPQAAQSMGGGAHLHDALGFFATGISLVLHPRNPMLPIVHANYRYFERLSPKSDTPVAWWFGGGADLTPSYLFAEDAQHFHAVHKHVCDAHDPTFYPTFKAWCDRYFYLPHRAETRGIGGIFFDDLHDRSPDALFLFAQDCAGAFLEAYLPIVLRRKDMPYTEAHKAWQLIRRSRYAEFNLVYDRGTVFGLRTTGRIESILMSLPPVAHWRYNYQPPADSAEAALLQVLQQPQAWV